MSASAHLFGAYWFFPRDGAPRSGSHCLAASSPVGSFSDEWFDRGRSPSRVYCASRNGSRGASRGWSGWTTTSSGTSRKASGSAARVSNAASPLAIHPRRTRPRTTESSLRPSAAPVSSGSGRVQRGSCRCPIAIWQSHRAPEPLTTYTSGCSCFLGSGYPSLRIMARYAAGLSP